MTVAERTTVALIRVLVVEDHELTRAGIKASLEQDPVIEVVGEAASSDAAISLMVRLKPDVALVDIRLRSGSGIDVARAARTIAPETKVLVLSAYDEEQYVTSLAKIGVSGYVVKTALGHELVRAIHFAASGWLVFGPEVAPQVIRQLVKEAIDSGEREPQSRHLTKREAEVLLAVSSGRTNCEIAEAMGIAIKTVEAHVAALLLKLGAKNRSEAVLVGARGGWLDRAIPGKVASSGATGALRGQT